MNSLVKVFSNFREFYSEINGATLTGAIDVIVVEQPDGSFQCSPFHVRFGKLGVLRSREKVVDIEINGEPVDIHMKLGESGEAFFVEECPEEESEALPDNLATSPIPQAYFPSKFSDDTLANVNDSIEKVKSASDDIQLPLPLPRRNSIDLSKNVDKDENAQKFENQASDYSHRRHTDNVLERPNLSDKLQEYTTQKLRQEWAEHEEIFQFDVSETDKYESSSPQDVSTKNAKNVEPMQADNTLSTDEKGTKDSTITDSNTSSALSDTPVRITVEAEQSINVNNNSIKEESKSKKKRRKKSQMKKKNAQRKSSSSSSVGSNAPLEGNICTTQNMDDEEGDAISVSMTNNTNSSSNDELNAKSGDQVSAALVTADAGDEGPGSATSKNSPKTPPRIPDLDIHFFSDTEVTSSAGNGASGTGRSGGRPSSPIQSDSELELSLREKDVDVELESKSASWKWGELPTPEPSEQKDGAIGNGQRNFMLSGMFNFMKRTSKIRHHGSDDGVYLSELDAAGMDPEMAALYFPRSGVVKEIAPSAGMLNADDDRESGNGTSLPHSPSSLEGQKSLDSDYEDGKHLDFVAMSLCGLNENGGDPSDEEFDRHIVKYSDVCENPRLFALPNLVVRLNGKYYTWAAACPIVMTIITFQKPLSKDVIEQLMAKPGDVEKIGDDGSAARTTPITVAAQQAKRSWWYWRRTQNAGQIPPGSTPIPNTKDIKTDEKSFEKEVDDTAIAATQTTRPNTPDVSDNTLSKTDSTLNALNTSAIIENLEDLSSKTSNDNSNNNKNERFKKSLRLSSDAIKQLNLKDGMNEIEFSVTTAYQGTTRCKCYLFRWKHNDKVVISDIDGTITKSDVLGHILPIVGKDWAQLGVAQLFSKIEQNGYKLLYLSARAIGQARATREYLRSIRQGDVRLPNGPLLLNPTSLISAFHREVIERKPEQFKIACLSDIRDLFPQRDPFYAGYGNRINDVWAYRAVGIPIMRIFTINTKGELKHELTQTFQSSYCSMTYIVDQLFPPIKADEGSIEYSNFNYWRDPIQDLNIDLELSTTINSELNSTLTNSLQTIPEN